MILTVGEEEVVKEAMEEDQELHDEEEDQERRINWSC